MLDNNSNNSDNSNNSEDMQILELERGAMIHGEENTKFIIVKLGDVYYDETKETFVRNYKVREMIET